MNINKKFIICCIVTVLSVWGFNIIRHEIYSLDEPIFIKEYVEKTIQLLSAEENYEGEDGPVDKARIYGMHFLEFYYIDNFSNSSYISGNIDYATVSFPEINSVASFSTNNNSSGIMVDMFNQQTNYVYGVEIFPYRLNVITVDLGQVYLQDGRSFYEAVEEKGEVILTKIKVGNGESSRVVDVGRIKIRVNEKNEEKELFVEETYGTDNDINWNNRSYKALKDIDITGVNGEFYDYIKSFVDFKINDVDIEDINFPIKINDQEKFKVSYRVNRDDDGMKNIPVVIDTSLKLSVMDINREVRELDLYTINLAQDIVYYLEKAGNLNKLFGE